MGVSFNRVVILGNLGRDPELKYTQNQVPVCSFSIATTEKRKDQSGAWVDITEWHKIVAWQKTAENCGKYLTKGSKVLVEGKIQTRKYESKDGSDKYVTEIVAQSVQFLSTNKKEENANTHVQSDQQEIAAAQQVVSQIATTSFDDDDIPF